jgi:Ca-activated chloride channel family protein
MSSPLTLKTWLNSPVIPVAGSARLVYLLVEISGGEDAQSLPMNLGLVIDASESMHIRMVTEAQFKELVGLGNTKEVLTDGIPAWEIDSVPNEMVRNFPRKIDYVSEALNAVSEYLRPSDYFSLVGFASRGVLLIPMTPGSERTKLVQKASDLEYLHLGDETCMAEGLSLSYAEIREKQRPKLASRIILLTDGYTQDVKECYEWARRARKLGLAITTMGVGAEFNEDLLIPISEMTGGNAYYIESPVQIPDAFRQELGAALGVSYRNLKLHLQPSTGVGFRQVYRVLPELGNIERDSSSGDGHLCFLGHYDPNAPPAFLVEIVVPPLQIGTYRLVKMGLSWDDDHATPVQTAISSDIVVQISPSPPPTLNSRVMEIVNKVGAFKLGNYALEHAHNQDRSSAVKGLHQAASRLAEVGEPALAAEMARMAEVLQKQGRLDSNATKRLRYDTRRITQRLPS